MTQITTQDQQFHSEISENVRVLEKARKRINSEINSYLRKDDMESVRLFTNIYALLYFSWTEAYLVKLVHTPNGFSQTEKEFVLNNRDIIVKWQKCIDTAFIKLTHHDSTIPNQSAKIHTLVEAYLNTQAKIRNKIAHGQWANPLFSSNLRLDPDMKILMGLVDVIQIDLWFEVIKELALIVNGVIDARIHNNFLAHYNRYLNRLASIQNLVITRSKWTLEDKQNRLKLKAFKTN